MSGFWGLDFLEKTEKAWFFSLYDVKMFSTFILIRPSFEHFVGENDMKNYYHFSFATMFL